VDFSTRMDTAEAAKYLGKSRYWVQTHWRSEGIPCYQIGGEYFFLKDDLDAYISTKRIEPRSPSKPSSTSKDSLKVRLAS